MDILQNVSVNHLADYDIFKLLMDRMKYHTIFEKNSIRKTSLIIKLIKQIIIRIIFQTHHLVKFKGEKIIYIKFI